MNERAKGEAQQAGDPPDAKGQFRIGRNEGQTRRGMFRVQPAPAHGIGALWD
jgi:hypothetical protein